MLKANRKFLNKKIEWPKIKDTILCHYINPYFSKILDSSIELFHVDCFTEKGNYGDNAKKILLPMSSAVDIASVPSDLFAKYQISFYNDSQDVAIKTLGIE